MFAPAAAAPAASADVPAIPASELPAVLAGLLPATPAPVAGLPAGGCMLTADDLRLLLNVTLLDLGVGAGAANPSANPSATATQASAASAGAGAQQQQQQQREGVLVTCGEFRARLAAALDASKRAGALRRMVQALPEGSALPLDPLLGGAEVEVRPRCRGAGESGRGQGTGRRGGGHAGEKKGEGWEAPRWICR